MKFKSDRQRKAVMAHLRTYGHTVSRYPIVDYKYSPLRSRVDMTKPESSRDALMITMKGKKKAQLIVLSKNDTWDAWYNRNRFYIRGDYKNINTNVDEDIKIDRLTKKYSKEGVLNAVRDFDAIEDVRYVLSNASVKHPESNKLEDYSKRALVYATFIVEREQKLKNKILR